VIVLRMDLEAIEAVRNASPRGSTFTVFDLIQSAFELAGQQVAAPGAIEGRVILEDRLVGTWVLE
jgi:hypothetical protein